MTKTQISEILSENHTRIVKALLEGVACSTSDTLRKLEVDEMPRRTTATGSSLTKNATTKEPARVAAADEGAEAIKDILRPASSPPR